MNALVVLFLLGLIGFVLYWVLVGALAFARWRQKRTRREAMFLAAQHYNLSYATSHPVASVAYGFRSKGHGSDSANYLSGVWNGVAVTVFDAWYYVNMSESRMPLRRYTWLTVAVTEIDADWPHLTIEPETFATRMMDRTALGDLQFESDEFNRMYEVRCGGGAVVNKAVSFTLKLARRMPGGFSDNDMELLKALDPRVGAFLTHSAEDQKRFAYAFVDARMMDWLIEQRARYSFEVIGRYLVCYMPQGPTSEIRELLDALAAFRERIPRAAWSLFGGDGAADATTAVPVSRADRIVRPTPVVQSLDHIPSAPLVGEGDVVPADAAAVVADGEAGADGELPLIRPEELPLRPDDPRLAVLEAKFGADALRAAGLLRGPATETA